MTAPIRNPEPYELYRVVLDYEALVEGILDRIEDLNTPLEQIDMAAGFTRGNAQKLVGRGKSRLSRTFGWESLGKMLKGTGLALVLVTDDERFAPVKAMLTQRRRPREQANARCTRPAWLFTRDKAREMGKKRWSTLTPAQRKRLTRKAGKASARARKRRGALLVSTAQPSSTHGQSPSNT